MGKEKEILTAADIAKMLGVSTRRVRELAKRRNVGYQLLNRIWIFDPEDVERLRPGRVGKPKKTEN